MRRHFINDSEEWAVLYLSNICHRFSHLTCLTKDHPPPPIPPPPPLPPPTCTQSQFTSFSWGFGYKVEEWTNVIPLFLCLSLTYTDIRMIVITCSTWTGKNITNYFICEQVIMLFVWKSFQQKKLSLESKRQKPTTGTWQIYIIGLEFCIFKELQWN
jgi:hypothetical protein